jgi:hypothetical protein
MNTPSSRAQLPLIAFVFLLTAICFGQDVPKGVNYKRAAPDTNAKARTALEAALASSSLPTTFITGVISCGPILWNDLKPEQPALLKDSTPVTMFLSVPEPVQAEGRGFRTQDQRERFWKLVLDQFPDLHKGTVRIAKPNEIQFYWATIPFDIEEPFFAVETPTNVFIVNLKIENDVPVLFWIDRVDDLKKLKK